MRGGSKEGSSSGSASVTRNEFNSVDPANILEGKRDRTSRALAVQQAIVEPAQFKDAMKSKEKQQWLEAIKDELTSLKNNQTFEEQPVKLPEGKKAVGTRWVFKTKKDGDGKIVRYKARLVAKGYTQVEGQDYDDTFAPVVRTVTIRAILSIAINEGMQIDQLDIVTAFLYSEIDKEVYIEVPEGYDLVNDSDTSGKVLKAVKALYGLKQSPKLWNDHITKTLVDAGFTQSINDSGLLINVIDGDVTYVLIYVDDILVIARKKSSRKSVEKLLAKFYKLTVMGKVKYILGTKIDYFDNGKALVLSQANKLETLGLDLQKENAKSIGAPMNAGINLQQVNNSKLQKDYRGTVGRLQYPTNICRPDLSFAVSFIGRFATCYDEEHWDALQRIVTYSYQKRELGLKFVCNGNLDIMAYVDASFQSEAEKSITGYAVFLGGNLVAWRSVKQKIATLSTMEAELVALIEVIKELIWLQELLREMAISNVSTKVFEDNQALIASIKNGSISGRTKHFMGKLAFAREFFEESDAQLIYCETTKMVADGFTKAKSGTAFDAFVESLGLMNCSHLLEQGENQNVSSMAALVSTRVTQSKPVTRTVMREGEVLDADEGASQDGSPN